MTNLAHLDKMLDAIAKDDMRLERGYREVLETNHKLDRSLVSFQANKASNGDRWCKYKEGFSAALIRYLLDTCAISTGPILDPFAGSGTALFVSAKSGLASTGIELLPHSAEIIRVRNMLSRADRAVVAKQLRRFADRRSWERAGKTWKFPHLRITAGAFPADAEQQIGRFVHEIEQIDDTLLSSVLRFSCMCILESISYTRKDGQYLRWDQRSGRCLGKKGFDKGAIHAFTPAITEKLLQIADDLDAPQHMLFGDTDAKQDLAPVELLQGSCLERLPTLKASQFTGLITSPPYCNRYDYTRTYALELAFLGVDESRIKELRQAMLSCTVENRDKASLDAFTSKNRFNQAIDAWASHTLLQSIIEYLQQCRSEGTLNNNGIPRMIANYFKEMALVIFESARVLKPGAPLIMVNDNVRYQGAHIPVDLILSDFARSAGMEVERIWVLPRGKGNSSQQMAKHGRSEIRKCIYIWRKPKVSTSRARKQGQPVALAM